MQFQMTNELFYTRVLKQAGNDLSLHLKIQYKFGLDIVDMFMYYVLKFLDLTVCFITLQPFDVCTVNHQWIDTYTINIWASGH